jgi:ribulose-phosphate 3-epimerase
MENFRICPSILNADFNNLDAEIARIASVSEFLHLDIMDDKFVPNFTFEFETSDRIIRNCPIPVDVHLMIEDPDHLAIDYAESGAASVTFHFEAATDPERLIHVLHEAGVRVGLGIKPGTSFDEVSRLIPSIDMLLIMTVEPGFGGQSFMRHMMPKVSHARSVIDLLPPPQPWIEVDGGISLETIVEAAEAGADTFVAGSAVFRSTDPGKTILEMKSLLKPVTMGEFRGSV